MEHAVKIYANGDIARVYAMPLGLPAEYDFDRPIDEMASSRASLCRTRRLFEEGARANEFRWFVTIAPKDGVNGPLSARETRTLVTQAIKKIVRKATAKGAHIEYIGLLEFGSKDEDFAELKGRWHVHLIFAEIPPELLTPFSKEQGGLPKTVYKRLAQGVECCTCPLLADIGFVFIEEIFDDTPLVAYIEKNLSPERANYPKGLRRLFASRHLPRLEKVYEGTADEEALQKIAAGEDFLNHKTRTGQVIWCNMTDIKDAGIL